MILPFPNNIEHVKKILQNSNVIQIYISRYFDAMMCFYVLRF